MQQANQNFNFEGLSIDNLKNIMARIYKGSNQAEITEATAFLLAFGQTIQSVPIFVQILTQEPTNELRLLASIILKKFIAANLKEIGVEDREVLRQAILGRFFEEGQKRVQKGLALLIAAILKGCAADGQKWTDPIVVISERTKPGQPLEVRLQGFLLLSTILDAAGDELEDFYGDLFKFFCETIKDESAIIRKQTLVCVLCMYITVEDDELLQNFDIIYPSLMETFYNSLKENDEDTIEKTLEMLHALTSSKSELFNDAQLTKLIQMFCTSDVLMSKDLSHLFRGAMIDIILNIIKNFKTVVSKNEATLKKIIEVIFILACLKEEENPQDRETIQDAALFFIREAATLLPKKKSYPLYKEHLLKMFENENTDVVEGAFLILANIAEGCCEYLKRELPVIMKTYIAKGLESQHNGIKNATFSTLNHFAEFLSPDVLGYHEMIIPPMIQSLSTVDQKTLTGNIMCLEIFCDEMNEDIATYIPELLPKLIEIIDKPQNDIPSKRHAILAMASCSSVSKENFAPYASNLVPLLAHLINLNEPQYIELKATATKCLGTIVSGCIRQVPDLYRNTVEPLIPNIYESLKSTDNAMLKEYCFEFFYNLAHFLQQDFKPFLDNLVAMVFAVIESVQNVKNDEPQVLSLNPEDNEENDPKKPVFVDRNALEELSAALCCLGEMAKACPTDFAPYYEKTVQYIEFFSTYYDEYVRIQSLACYKCLAIALIKAETGRIPEFNRGLPCTQRFSADAEKFLFGNVWERLFYTVQHDDDIQLLITVMEILHEFCTDLGPASVDQVLDKITEMLVKLLQNETNAQSIAFEGEDEVHGELFGATTLAIISLSKACGEGFMVYFDKIYPELQKFITEDVSEDDVGEVLAIFAHATKEIPSVGYTYGLDMLQHCFKALDFGDEYINQNVAFCVGLIVENGRDITHPHYKDIMAKLRVIYENSVLAHTKDNAIAAIARMVYSNPSLVPLNMIVPAIVKEMPLQADPKENRTLIKMLVCLFETNIEILNGMEERCIELLIDGVAERKKYKIKDQSLIKAIGMILKKLSENDGAKQIIQRTASKLSQENVNALTELLSTEY